MASEGPQGGANNNFLHLVNSNAHPGFSRGSPSSVDYGLGTPQSINIDAFVPDRQMNRMPYRAASIQTSDSRPEHQSPYEAASAIMRDDAPSMVGHHHPLSSNSAAYPGFERSNSFAASDDASPDTPSHGRANITSDATFLNSGDAAGRFAEDASAPSWSELRTKAGKERKRLPLACIACRRKKIRCSGEKPACKHCLRSRIPCVYKVSTRKAAPRTDYMAMLDKRLKRMEERVIKIIPKDQQGEIADTGRAIVRPPLPPAPPKAGGTKKRIAEQAFDHELEEWSNAKAGSKNGTTQELPAMETEKRKDLNAADDHSLLLEGAEKLPSKELQEHLAEVFFEYVYGQAYHLLHKPSFMRKLALGTIPPVLILAVCGISARFSNHPDVRTEPVFLRGEEWAAAARDIALRRYDTPNITILIVYLLIGLHEFGTCQGGRSWMFGGMAQRMAYALQLHRDLDHDPKTQGPNGKGEGLTSTDREIRRRTMWSCFVMDRFNSSGTDRPVFVAEQYIRAQLPIKEAYYALEIDGPTEDLEGNVPNPVAAGNGQMSNAKENMGVAAHLVRLVAIWGRLIHYLNLGGKERDQHPMWSDKSMFSSISKATEAWKTDLPASLHYNPENLQNHASEKMANQFIFLHIVHNQTILFMNRFALPTPGSRTVYPKDMPADFIQAASRAAFDAANQISALVHEAMDHSVVAPFAGYCAFFSSTVHIYGAFSKNASLEASSKQNLAWNVKYLTKMKKYWGMFHFMTENLRELYRRHADAARQGVSGASQPASGTNGDASIFQYGDWYDRYPHGVSGSDFEGPSADVKKEPGSDAVLGQKSDLQTVEEFFSKVAPLKRIVAPSQQVAHNKKAIAATSNKKRRASKPDPRPADAGAPSKMDTSNSQQLSNASSSAATQHQPQHELQLQQMEQLQRQRQLQHVSNDLASHSSNPTPTTLYNTAFPPGFQASSNPLLAMNGPQQLMSQLDRQMVLNSYAGIDNNNINNYGSMLDMNQPYLDSYNLDAFSGYGQNLNHDSRLTSPPTVTSPAMPDQVTNGYWGDPSSAWFMPFNMNPPTIGEDNNLLGRNPGDANGGAGNGIEDFDWSNFGGFGDSLPAGSFPPTGLTPGAMEGTQGGGSSRSIRPRDGGQNPRNGYNE